MHISVFGLLPLLILLLLIRLLLETKCALSGALEHLRFIPAHLLGGLRPPPLAVASRPLSRRLWSPACHTTKGQL